MADVPPVPDARTKKLVQTAYTLAIVSLLGSITSIPAIIYSIRALLRLRKVGGNKSDFRKATFGLVFASCVLGFMAFAVWSMFDAAQTMANTIRCENNLKILGLGAKLYASDNRDTFPGPNWCDILLTNQVDWISTPNDTTNSFLCPEFPQKQKCSYAMNAQVVGVVDSGQLAGDTVLLFESQAGWNAVGGPEIASAPHYGSRLNYVRIDGTVEEVQLKDVKKLRWVPFTNFNTK